MIGRGLRWRPLLRAIGPVWGALVFWAIFSCCSAFASAADWPHWRGPTHDGIAEADGVFSAPFALDVAWVRPLGHSYSGLSIAGGRVVTMYASEGSDALAALDAATGKTLWSREIAATFKGHAGSAGGANSVPTIDGDTVYALGPRGELLAVGLADGSERWRRKLTKEVGAIEPPFGFATSPLVVGDRLIVQAGGLQGRAVVGLDKTDGSVVWTAGDDSVSYQSPIPVELAGLEQVLTVTDGLLSGNRAEHRAGLLSSSPQEARGADARPARIRPRVAVRRSQSRGAAHSSKRRRVRDREALELARIEEHLRDARPQGWPSVRIQR